MSQMTVPASTPTCITHTFDMTRTGDKVVAQVQYLQLLALRDAGRDGAADARRQQREHPQARVLGEHVRDGGALPVDAAHVVELCSTAGLRVCSFGLRQPA
jgi:hypothetical protein